jgi:P-loop containing NTP hydrolase pore-1
MLPLHTTMKNFGLYATRRLTDANCFAVATACCLLSLNYQAKNLYGKEPTQTGKAVAELQEALPKARIIYCSATACSEPSNMAYMTRLGLWGQGTTYGTIRKQFLSNLNHLILAAFCDGASVSLVRLCTKG